MEPGAGSFLSIDDYAFYERTGTLWSWPRQNPIAWRDPSGHRPDGPSQPYSDPQFRQGSELGFALGSAALAITLGPWWVGVLATGATVANHDEMGKFVFAVPSIAGAAGRAGGAGAGESCAAKDSLPALRQAYVDDVRELEGLGSSARAAGQSPQDTARMLVDIRNQLKVVV